MRYFKMLVTILALLFLHIDTKAQQVSNISYQKGVNYEIQIGNAETVSAKYSFGNGLSLGVGTGFIYSSVPLSYPTNESKMIVPFFAEARYNFLNAKVSPFADVRLGGIADYKNCGVGNIAIASIGSDFGKHWALYLGIKGLYEKQLVANPQSIELGNIFYVDKAEAIFSLNIGVAYRF